MKKDKQATVTTDTAPEAETLAGFNFNIGKKGKAIMTWTQRGFTFNKDAIELLGSPAYIVIGLDEKAKRLAIKAADKDSTAQKYVFASAGRREKFAFVTATNVREAVAELLGEQPEKGGISYAVEFDKVGEFGIIELTKGTKNKKQKEDSDES